MIERWVLLVVLQLAALQMAIAPEPTRTPTPSPTFAPTYKQGVPTPGPMAPGAPSQTPTLQPTNEPTASPPSSPETPMPPPTEKPTTQPTMMPTKLPTMRPTKLPSAEPTTTSGAPTSYPTTKVRTQVKYQVVHMLYGMGSSSASFDCDGCMASMAHAVKAVVPAAKIRRDTIELRHSASHQGRRRLISVPGMRLTYVGSFVAEDTGEASAAAAFASVKSTFEGGVASGAFVTHLHAAAGLYGADGLKSVTSTDAVMTRLEEEAGPDGDSETKSEDEAGLPAYGQALISLGALALGSCVTYVLYLRYTASAVMASKLKYFDDVEGDGSNGTTTGRHSQPGEPDGWGDMDTSSPFRTLEKDSNSKQPQHHTPLAARTQAGTRRFDTQPDGARSPLRGATSAGAVDIVTKTSGEHIMESVSGARDDGDSDDGNVGAGEDDGDTGGEIFGY